MKSRRENGQRLRRQFNSNVTPESIYCLLGLKRDGLDGLYYRRAR